MKKIIITLMMLCCVAAWAQEKAESTINVLDSTIYYDANGTPLSKTVYTYHPDGQKATEISCNWNIEEKKWVYNQKKITETSEYYNLSEEYRWDVEKNRWIGTNKSESTNGQINEDCEVFDIRYSWDYAKNDWRIKDKFIIYYEEQYMGSQSSQYTYRRLNETDEELTLIRKSYSINEGVSGDISRSKSYTYEYDYDLNELYLYQLTESEFNISTYTGIYTSYMYDKIINELVPSSRQIVKEDNEYKVLLRERCFFNTDTNDWYVETREEYFYLPNQRNYKYCLVYNVKGFNWETGEYDYTLDMENPTKYEFEYNEEGRMTLSTCSFKHNGIWVTMKESECDYDSEGRQTLSVRYHWDWSNKTNFYVNYPTMKSEARYNDKGILVYSLGENYDYDYQNDVNDIWVKLEFVYNDNGELIRSYKSFGRDLKYITENTFDEEDRIIKSEFFVWDRNINDWARSQYTSFNYFYNGALKIGKEYNWDSKNYEWIHERDIYDFYSPLTTAIENIYDYAPSDSQRIFNLNGNRVSSSSFAEQKGLFIINGKKVLKK